MRQLATEHGIALLDLREVLPKSLAFFYDDVHFNIQGAATTGSALASFLLEQQLLDRGHVTRFR